MAMRSRSSSPTIAFAIANIDKLDFDDHRKPSSTHNGSDHSGPGGLLRDDESLLSNVIDGVIERDRRKMHYSVTKYTSFACAVLCWQVFSDRSKC